MPFPSALLVALVPLQEPTATPYSLFHPVPRDEMRGISPDRPSAGESPITVDAGHAEFEIGLADWTRDGRDDVLVGLQSNFKLGLTASTDIQFVFDAFTTEDNASGDNNRGFSDLSVRLKWNLWGNDGGDSALALLPFIKLPTGTDLSNDEVEGGLSLPFSLALTDSIDLGLMGQFNAVYNELEDAHDLEFLHTATLGFPMGGATSSYVEYAGLASEDDYGAFFNAGLAYEVNRDLVLDGGVRLGLTDDVDDLGAFLGFTARY